MSASSLITSRASAPLETGYIPVIDPASATVEEMDEWILAQGGQPISPEELKDFVAQAQWADVKAKSGIFPELPPRGTAMVEKERDLVATIRGSWSGKLSSSDKFAARKADEIRLEE